MASIFDLPQRLQDKIMPEPNSGCWLWEGGVAGKGYGVTRHNGRQRYVHAVVYELLVGQVPDGLECDHLCRNTYCVNPHHIEPVTHKENLRRSTAIAAAKAWTDSITRCPKGHEYDEKNTYRREGKKHCRQCAKLACRAYDERNKSQRAAAARAHRLKTKTIRAHADQVGA